jgi:hypothetical protein
MNVEFTDDELVEALAVIINRIADGAGLSDKDRAMLKRWRSSQMKLGTDDMNDFVTKANDDITRNNETRQKSQLRKPDWVR